MVRATAVISRRDRGSAEPQETVTLDREARYRRRVVMSTDGGRRFLLDLPEATYLADGDLLSLEDGGTVMVRAADEALLEVRTRDPLALMRIAWHVGNRHTPCEITPAALYIQPDHVLAEMVEGLGASVHAVTRPFEPEGGAYGGKGPLASGHHHHHHGDGRAHDHGPGDGHHQRPQVKRAIASEHRSDRAVWRPGGD